jgi:hypothetical protein
MLAPCGPAELSTENPPLPPPPPALWAKIPNEVSPAVAMLLPPTEPVAAMVVTDTVPPLPPDPPVPPTAAVAAP